MNGPAGGGPASVPLGEEFARVAVKELSQGCERVEACLGRLTTEQIWFRQNAVENSVGNLVLHVAGNVRQWIVGGVGGAPDARDRDWEFANREQFGAAELAERLRAAVDGALAVLDGLPASTLLERRRIQVYDVTVLHAVIHVLTHFSGHVGQIIWATKHVTATDLGFYGYLKGSSGGKAGQAP